MPKSIFPPCRRNPRAGRSCAPIRILDKRLSIKVQTIKMKYSIILCIALVTAFQTTGHIKYKSSRKACCASILTYCATHTLPYLCTPTSVSCLSLEPFSTVHQRVETVFRHAEKTPPFSFTENRGVFFCSEIVSMYLYEY